VTWILFQRGSANEKSKFEGVSAKIAFPQIVPDFAIELGSIDSTNQLVPFFRQVPHQDRGPFSTATRSKATSYMYFNITFYCLQHLDRH
jgi:hypothetical protein